MRLELAIGHRLRAVELCRALKLSPSHVSRMVERAEAAGLVTWGPDPEDSLSAEELDTLVAVLGRIEIAAQTYDPNTGGTS